MQNRNRVGMAFHRQACEYDRHASVQKRVIKNLLQLVHGHLSIEPASVLDIGCGTGMLLSSLQQQYPALHTSGLDLAFNMTKRAGERLGPDALLVQGDAVHLPFASCVFDLVVSTSTLQWLDDPGAFFQESHRVMSPYGLLCIAFFGGRTLCELRECFSDAVSGYAGNCGGMRERLHSFRDKDELRQILGGIQFDRVMLMSEIETEYYPGAYDLLRSIKNIGAGVNKKGGSGLGWRKVLNETARLYQERYQSDGMLPASYEVFYVIAGKSGRYA